MEKDSNGRSPKLVQAALSVSGSLYSLISCKLKKPWWLQDQDTRFPCLLWVQGQASALGCFAVGLEALLEPGPPPAALRAQPRLAALR